MSCGVSGPRSTVLARRHCKGTCSQVRVTLGCAKTLSFRLLPHHVYVCSKTRVAFDLTRCRLWPLNADRSASSAAAATAKSGFFLSHYTDGFLFLAVPTKLSPSVLDNQLTYHLTIVETLTVDRSSNILLGGMMTAHCYISTNQ